MITSSVARRYAKALFELLDAPSVEPMRAGLRGLSRALSESPALKHAVASPAFTLDKKIGILAELSERAGCPAVAKGFLGQLLQKGRVDQLSAIADAFAALADEAKGVRQVAVTSAMRLTARAQEGIERRLSELLRSEVSVTYREEPDVLSGLRIQIGSTVYDSSVRNRLDLMRSMMTKE